MKKHMFLLWIVYGGLLIIMFFISSTDILLVHERSEVKRVAVIMNHDKDDEYINLKKGIERACTDYNIDLDFIKLNTGGDEEEQIHIILQEAQEEADALIIAAINTPRVLKTMESRGQKVPLIVLGGRKEEALLPSLSVSLQAGLCGFKEDLAKQRSDEKVYLIASDPSLRQIEGAQEEIETFFGGEGRETVLKRGELGRKDLEAMLAQGERPVLVALDKASFSDIARIISEQPELHGEFSGIYGVGATVYLLNKLEQGMIDGMIIWNEYEEGYAAVELALEAMNAEGSAREKSIQSYYIDRSTLLSEEFTGMLYPID